MRPMSCSELWPTESAHVHTEPTILQHLAPIVGFGRQEESRWSLERDTSASEDRDVVFAGEGR